MKLFAAFILIKLPLSSIYESIFPQLWKEYSEPFLCQPCDKKYKLHEIDLFISFRHSNSPWVYEKSIDIHIECIFFLK